MSAELSTLFSRSGIDAELRSVWTQGRFNKSSHLDPFSDECVSSQCQNEKTGAALKRPGLHLTVDRST